MRTKPAPVFISILLLSLSVVPLTHGALRTWDGGGGDNLWMTPANWSLDTAPVGGDDLLFPSGAARLSNSNNFPSGTIFNSVTFSGGGYSLQGTLLTLNAGITNLAGNNSTFLPISLMDNQTFAASDGALSTEKDIDTAGHTLNFYVAGTGEIQVHSPISGTGGISKTGSSLLTFAANNSYFGLTEIFEGKITLAHSNALGIANSGTIVYPGGTVGLQGTLSVAEPLTLSGKLQGALTLAAPNWTGPITLVSNTATVEVVQAAPLTISALISGAGSLTKISPGILQLTANNTYTGPTTNQAGTLIIDGFQPASPVTVNLGATLKGNGTVGPVTCLDGSSGFLPVISPGGLGIGRLTTSNLFMSSVTHLSLQLNGTVAGTGYGQLKVNGSASITNAGLDVSISPGFIPALGDSFMILDNDGTDPILGEFRFYPEGTVYNIGGYPFQISYQGGTGNDVVLTHVGSAIGFSSIAVLTDGSIFMQATGGVEGVNYILQAATNLSPPVQWTNLGSYSSDFNGRVFLRDMDAPSFPMRFYRAMSP